MMMLLSMGTMCRLRTPTSNRALLGVAVLFLSFFSNTITFAQAEPTLIEIHVITRHGSRLPLTKDAESLDEGGPGTLTALGQKMHYDLGQWLRNRYNPSTGFFNSYYSSRAVLSSSSLHRTIVSANSLLYGLYPTSARDSRNETQSLLKPYNIPPTVPVMSEKAENDVTIRGYEKCEVGIGLNALYSSTEWNDLEQEHLSLLEHVGSMEEFVDYTDPLLKRVPLQDLWNVYDAIDVVKTECGFDSNSIACQVSNPSLDTILNDTDWQQLKALAYQAELLKYNSKTAGKYAGGLLLQTILGRMESNKFDALSVFYLYSAHYPTILGVLAALESDPTELIPSYAAALILELYKDPTNGEKSIQISFKQGYETNDTQPIVLGQGCANTEPCSLAIVNASFLGDFTSTSWCNACKYGKADICYASNLTALQKQVAAALNNGTGGSDNSPSSSSNSGMPPYAAALIGLFSGMAFAIVCVMLVIHCRRGQNSSAKNVPREGQEEAEAEAVYCD